jgi:plastocyanin
MRRTLALLAVLGAGGGSDSHPPDAPPHPDGTPADARPDAMPSTVMLVSCTGVTPAANVTTVGLSFSPVDVTINAGDILHFMPTGLHNMTSDTPGEFATPTSQEACLKFTAPGLFLYHCSVHPTSMMGSVTVN